MRMGEKMQVPAGRSRRLPAAASASMGLLMDRGAFMRSVSRLLILGAAVLTGGQRASAVEPIRPEQFSRLQALIKPDPNEDKWTQIPWLTDLWQARKIAAEQGKPILLWEMDGHPLGCT